ncbi:aconitate hydratase [Modicella reniformis]|uniref:Aconitate hydratase, mitochondrial n=1 Tax=Modicella reniformis TaxID=1440133 RepID=A0A9P6LSG6_9FUNG|nr:aconitate hydratase [Modicella reniformis]
MTLSEKILYSHLAEPEGVRPIRGQTYLKLSPDASAQMAILQFMLAGMPTTAVPSSIHCDHLIVGHKGAAQDLVSSIENNKEIFDFLQSAAEKYGMAFWKPGSGIIHQIVLENYAAPGLLMLGTDSHTPNAGGLGAVAIGVGGADAVDAMANIPWELKAPEVIGVKLTGKLNGWTSPKDVILHLAGKLTVRGGTGHIVEYFGQGIDTLSCTGMGTICNMGAEVGATTSLFPFTNSMSAYLHATSRGPVAEAASQHAHFLKADDGAVYDNVIEIDLSALEPHINGPFTPDLATPLSKFADVVKKNGWKDEVKVGLIGSCTNSSYEDMDRVTSLAKQAVEKGIKSKAGFFITPGSEQIRATIERDGQTAVLEKVGGVVLANACGPCIGQWTRDDLDGKEENSILTSFNRNFKNRNDGNATTMNFLASPEVVTALSLSGKLTFNPMTDPLVDAAGSEFMLQPPYGDNLPKEGFIPGNLSYTPPDVNQPNSSIPINVDPKSTRLQLLEPFSPGPEGEFNELQVLLKIKGKCTTDHISAAGPWLKYKGHLENISNNTLNGALNADTDKVNVVTNVFTGTEGAIHEVGREYQKMGKPWIVVTDHNYGEGSAREHAALQVRYLGCPLILARSFARIHQTNLKKQGVLPLTFADPADWDKIHGGDVIESTIGVSDLVAGRPGKNDTPEGGEITLIVRRPNGEKYEISALHTMSKDQTEWFKKGSALNAASG